MKEFIVIFKFLVGVINGSVFGLILFVVILFDWKSVCKRNRMDVFILVIGFVVYFLFYIKFEFYIYIFVFGYVFS